MFLFRAAVLAAALGLNAAGASANDPPMEPMPGMPMPTAAPTTTGAPMAMSRMAGVIDIGTPMAREGSGTSWMPDATTVYGRMTAAGRDMTMIHGALFARFVDAATPRGAGTFDAPGWFMYERAHAAGPISQLGFRIMLTPDPLTVGGQGYPLLFQTGEQWHDQPLHDVQHPHDLISELSATYSRRLGDAASAYLYLGYPGEPALGPPAYMHRPIAYDFAAAPIGHHWQDATHVTFGVVTAGLALRRFKLEGSTFTGREPNEARYNFDPAHLDSTSARLSWNPDANVAAQVSYGFVASPEAREPQVDIRRTTASLMYTRQRGAEGFWTSTLVWGRNDPTSGAISDSYLFETELRSRGTALFARFEQVRKTGVDLALPAPLDAATYGIGAFTVGYTHDVHGTSGLVPALGMDLTLNARPGTLSRIYGSAVPITFEVFYRLRWAPVDGG